MPAAQRKACLIIFLARHIEKVEDLENEKKISVS